MEKVGEGKAEKKPKNKLDKRKIFTIVSVAICVVLVGVSFAFNLMQKDNNKVAVCSEADSKSFIASLEDKIYNNKDGVDVNSITSKGNYTNDSNCTYLVMMYNYHMRELRNTGELIKDFNKNSDGQLFESITKSGLYVDFDTINNWYKNENIVESNINDASSKMSDDINRAAQEYEERVENEK